MNETPHVEVTEAPQGSGPLAGTIDPATQGLIADAIQYFVERFPDQYGRAVHLGIKASGYVKDPSSFDAYYEQNREVIDGYLRHLDVSSVAQETLTAKARRYKWPIIVGVGAGLGAAWVASTNDWFADSEEDA